MSARAFVAGVAQEGQGNDASSGSVVHGLCVLHLRRMQPDCRVELALNEGGRWMVTPRRDDDFIDESVPLTALDTGEPEEGYEAWKTGQIEQACQEEDAGDFATDAEVRAFFDRWSTPEKAARDVRTARYGPTG